MSPKTRPPKRVTKRAPTQAEVRKADASISRLLAHILTTREARASVDLDKPGTGGAHTVRLDRPVTHYAGDDCPGGHVEMAVSEEREACARLAEEECDGHDLCGCRRIAAAIRARGKK